MLKRSLLFLSLLPTVQVFASTQPLNLSSIANFLQDKVAQGTYGPPGLNTLVSDVVQPGQNGNWLIQTPNLWGKSLSSYNQSTNIPATQASEAEGYYWRACPAGVEPNSPCDEFSTCLTLPTSVTATENLCVPVRKSTATNAYVGAGEMPLAIYQSMTNAKNSVDITTLEPDERPDNKANSYSFATGAFTELIHNALLKLDESARQSKKIINVRILQGYFNLMPPKDSTAQQVKAYQQQLKLNDQNFLSVITKGLPNPNNLNIYLGSMRACGFDDIACATSLDPKSPVFWPSWNHGKIINIDGGSGDGVLLLGGENLWGNDYLVNNPVVDYNISIQGPVGNGANYYANTLWAKLGGLVKAGQSGNACTSDLQGSTGTTCAPALVNQPLSFAPVIPSPKTGLSVNAMFVTKLTNGVLPASDQPDASELARVYAIANAVNDSTVPDDQKQIDISQQALLGVGGIPPVNTGLSDQYQNWFAALAYALDNGVSVDIVTSDENASGYSPNDKQFAKFTSDICGYLKDKANIAHMQLRYVAYDSGNTENETIGNHSKLWLINNHLFYAGSHNLYGSSLQQFGVIIDSVTAATMLRTAFWNPMWVNAYDPFQGKTLSCSAKSRVR